MTLGWIVVLIGIAFLFANGRHLVRAAATMAEQDAAERNDAGGTTWYVFIIIAGLGIGATATRWYWQSIPPGDYSMGGLFFLFVAFFVFFIAWMIAGSLLAWISSMLSRAGRLGMLFLVIVFFGVAWVVPMQQAAKIERQKALNDELQRYQADLARLQSEMERTPHAPLDKVPDMLEVQRDGQGIHVTNRADRRLLVNVGLVLADGRRIERCSVGVRDDPNCVPGSTGCSYVLAKDGTPIAAPVASYDHQPMFLPGQTRTYSYFGCDARFTGAPLEFSVWDGGQDRYIFKSDSMFLPAGSGAGH